MPVPPKKDIDLKKWNPLNPIIVSKHYYYSIIIICLFAVLKLYLIVEDFLLPLYENWDWKYIFLLPFLLFLDILVSYHCVINLGSWRVLLVEIWANRFILKWNLSLRPPTQKQYVLLCLKKYAPLYSWCELVLRDGYHDSL